MCLGGYSRVFGSMAVPKEKVLEISSTGHTLCAVLFNPPHIVQCWGVADVVKNTPSDLVPAL